MKNPLGLVKIITGGSANTTRVEIDGKSVMAKRATIVIDPHLGENQIRLQCFSQQKNKHYEDGEWQTFCGIAEGNLDFFRTLMTLIQEVPDSDLTDRWPSNGIPPRVMDVLDFIFKARHAEDTDEQAKTEQP